MKQQQGYIAIVTVLIISAVSLGIATTVSLLAIGEAQSAFAVVKGEDTLGFVEGCMEDALQEVHDSASYAGGTMSRPEGTCSITVSQAGSVWTVTATTTATAYKRTVRVVVNRGSTMTIISWKEI